MWSSTVFEIGPFPYESRNIQRISRLISKSILVQLFDRINSTLNSITNSIQIAKNYISSQFWLFSPYIVCISLSVLLIAIIICSLYTRSNSVCVWTLCRYTSKQTFHRNECWRMWAPIWWMLQPNNGANSSISLENILLKDWLCALQAQQFAKESKAVTFSYKSLTKLNVRPI